MSDKDLVRKIKEIKDKALLIQAEERKLALEKHRLENLCCSYVKEEAVFKVGSRVKPKGADITEAIEIVDYKAWYSRYSRQVGVTVEFRKTKKNGDLYKLSNTGHYLYDEFQEGRWELIEGEI